MYERVAINKANVLFYVEYYELGHPLVCVSNFNPELYYFVALILLSDVTE